MPDRREWTPRPIQSALLRAFIFLAPLAVGIGVTGVLSRVVARPEGGAAIAWWIAIPLTSILSIIAVERAVRRLSPLAVLLRLSMAFPDAAPSRIKVAKRSRNLKKLKRWVHTAHERGRDDDLTTSAEMILALAAALDAHDPLTKGHSERVGAFADLLAAEMKLPKEGRDRLRWAALLHDIGKLRVPAKILNKEGPLTEREREIVNHHPHAGLDLAGPLVPWLGEWGKTILEHHERFDGRGYPNQLAGDRISLGARIIGVADAYEVMVTGRPYKRAMGANAARQEIATNAGAQFDPQVVRALLNISLGRLWRRIGLMSWVAQLPLLGTLPRAAQQLHVATQTVASTAKSAATVAAVGVAAASLPVVASAEATDPNPASGATAEVLSSTVGADEGGPYGVRDGRPGDRGKPAGTPGHGPGGSKGKGKAHAKGHSKDRGKGNRGRPESAGKKEGSGKDGSGSQGKSESTRANGSGGNSGGGTKGARGGAKEKGKD